MTAGAARRHVELAVRTSVSARVAVQEIADSKIAVRYGVGCALGNVLLALWGVRRRSR